MYNKRGTSKLSNPPGLHAKQLIFHFLSSGHLRRRGGTTILNKNTNKTIN
jgi:hypothetical protein